METSQSVCKGRCAYEHWALRDLQLDTLTVSWDIFILTWDIFILTLDIFILIWDNFIYKADT